MNKVANLMARAFRAMADTQIFEYHINLPKPRYIPNTSTRKNFDWLLVKREQTLGVNQQPCIALDIRSFGYNPRTLLIP